MKRTLLIGALGLLLAFVSFHGAWAFGLKDVAQMTQDGIPDSLIIQKIDHSGKNFRLDARDMHELKQAGVSDEVISAMLQTEDREDEADSYYYDGYYYPRVSVGLGFGTYYGPYWPYYGGYGRYGHYRYHGYYSPRYYGYHYYGRPGYGYSRPGFGYSGPGAGTTRQRYYNYSHPGTPQPSPRAPQSGPVTRHR
jgi:hypothetical protein